MNKIIVVNKTAGMTSHDVVNKIRRIFNTKRVGHTGTLDPQATGVLVLLVGRATKILPYLEKSRKEYIAEIEFGKKTDTGDIWGNVIETGEIKAISETMLHEALSSFLGHSMQKPPMVSAIKKDGKKLHIIESIRNNIAKNRSLELIADFLEEKMEIIELVSHAIEENSELDDEDVLDLIKEQWELLERPRRE